MKDNSKAGIKLLGLRVTQNGRMETNTTKTGDKEPITERIMIPGSSFEIAELVITSDMAVELDPSEHGAVCKLAKDVIELMGTTLSSLATLHGQQAFDRHKRRMEELQTEHKLKRDDREHADDIERRKHERIQQTVAGRTTQ